LTATPLRAPAALFSGAHGCRATGRRARLGRTATAGARVDLAAGAPVTDRNLEALPGSPHGVCSLTVFQPGGRPFKNAPALDCSEQTIADPRYRGTSHRLTDQFRPRGSALRLGEGLPGLLASIKLAQRVFGYENPFAQPDRVDPPLPDEIVNRLRVDPQPVRSFSGREVSPRGRPRVRQPGRTQGFLDPVPHRPTQDLVQNLHEIRRTVHRSPPPRPGAAPAVAASS